MKREDLKKLLGDAATDDVLDKIMGMNGVDIESHKTKLSEAETTRDQFKTQLDEANTAIEGFKKLKPEELQAAADDYKAKWEQAQTDSKNQLAALKFDHALDGALTSAKARNPKAVKALLSTEALKLNEDGSILGLKEQLEAIQKDNDYLFEGEKPAPKIVTGGNNQPVLGNSFVAAARKGAQLPEPKP